MYVVLPFWLIRSKVINLDENYASLFTRACQHGYPEESFCDPRPLEMFQ
jgi:hypothetical protein